VRRRGSHILENMLADGGENVSLTRRPAAVYGQKDSWYTFLLVAELVSGLTV
jgi:hypothetical protein